MTARRAAWAALFLAGAAFWVVLLDRAPGTFAGPPGTLEDWPKEYRYLAVLQQAVREARVPYVLSEPIVFSRKFLAIPETCLSPQIALLLVLTPGAFVVANTLLLHAAFCAGVVALARRFRLALVPAAAFYLLAGFNGHLTAHLAVGHSMWVGMLLLPAFLLPLVSLAEDERAPRAPILLALAMTAILFQGALHVFAWCVLLLLLVAAFRPSRLRPIVVGPGLDRRRRGAAPAARRLRRAAPRDRVPVRLSVDRRPPARPRHHPAARRPEARRPLRRRQPLGARRLRRSGGPRADRGRPRPVRAPRRPGSALARLGRPDRRHVGAGAGATRASSSSSRACRSSPPSASPAA